MERTPFIPAWFDDLGLSTAEYRVLCNLWRRHRVIGGRRVSYPGAKNIVKVCRISRDTLWLILKSLEDRQLLQRQRRGGKSNLYILLVPNTASGQTAHPADLGGYRLAGRKGRHSATSGGQRSAEKNGHQGTLEKDPHLKGDVEGAAPSPNWLSDQERKFIVRTLGLIPAILDSALQAFLRYKRPYPKDPRDAMAVVRFFRTNKDGKSWLQQMNSLPEAPEPPQWREVLRQHSADSIYVREGEKPWSEYCPSERQTIWALVRQFVLIAPPPDRAPRIEAAEK